MTIRNKAAAIVAATAVLAMPTYAILENTVAKPAAQKPGATLAIPKVVGMGYVDTASGAFCENLVPTPGNDFHIKCQCLDDARPHLLCNQPVPNGFIDYCTCGTAEQLRRFKQIPGSELLVGPRKDDRRI